jgi:hypothetical protein
MKVFFIASQRGKTKFDQNYKKIFDTIEKLGHKNLDARLFDKSVKEFYDELKKEGPHKFSSFFSVNLKLISEADVNVFECSEQSFSIGYMVQNSLEQNKPTIVLFTQPYEPFFLLDVKDDKLIVQGYTLETLENDLKKAFEKASTVADKRFNFFISPKYLTYLQQESRRNGITKSTFIRNLILEHKRKHANELG